MMSFRLALLFLGVVSAGCSSAPSGSEPPPQGQATVAYISIAEVLGVPSRSAEVDFVTTRWSDPEQSVHLIWRQASGTRRIDAVFSRKGVPDQFGYFLFQADVKPSIVYPEDAMLCDWDEHASRNRSPSAGCGSFGSSGRPLTDWIWKLARGSAIEKPATRTIAGELSDCYSDVRDGRTNHDITVCISRNDRLPLLFSDPKGDEFVASSVRRDATGELRPGIGHGEDKFAVDPESLRLPESISVSSGSGGE